MENKIVIVTGAANGIGKGIAEAFIEKGAIVILADLNLKAGQALQKELGDHSLFVQTDVRKEEDIINLMNTTLTQFNKIDILINNAGVFRFTPLHEFTVEAWDDVIHTNLRSVFIASKEASKHMKNGGSIVNIASTRAKMSEPNSEAYAATKGGIVALTHALAASLSDYNITVNAISPGWIQTENYEDLREKDHTQHLSNRVGKPSDIAKACLYLTDSENNFVNGENLTIDGGMTRKMIYEG
ncbi:3-oxoacyl-[acyl-carrier-protein] reductase FabG [Bacillus sp. THAF10]|uniref:SDR family NAD(P)-dependent oxidoreductase n=1 Tax=Bacillus sp. THAF10 TaxID=2587848 RepID=UPI001267AB5D|nr:SDR family oxidoreductase [Bacillus sp. THAF10]QFT90549.1 3-oxoacyl-[acyl-carrier-protein] reductase FabG [Bacillus sp. THAF10]